MGMVRFYPLCNRNNQVFLRSSGFPKLSKNCFIRPKKKGSNRFWAVKIPIDSACFHKDIYLEGCGLICHKTCFQDIPSPSLTSNLKMMVSKRNLLFLLVPFSGSMLNFGRVWAVSGHVPLPPVNLGMRVAPP